MNTRELSQSIKRDEERMAMVVRVLHEDFPLLSTEGRPGFENGKVLTEAMAKRFAGIYTPESVRACVAYEKDNLKWLRPTPPKPATPPPPPKPEYDEGGLLSWQLPLDSPEILVRRASREAVRDYLNRMRKREAWKAENS